MEKKTFDEIYVEVTHIKGDGGGALCCANAAVKFVPSKEATCRSCKKRDKKRSKK